MIGMLRTRRSHAVVSGLLLLLLGAWGALIPFIGPYFHYSYTPSTTWTYNTDRLWLEILPGGAAFLGGLLLILPVQRVLAMFGALLAAAAGAWFALGTLLSPLWNHNVAMGGSPVGSPHRQIVEQVGFFTGLGIVIVFLAAVALGRIAALPSLAGATPAPTLPIDETQPTEPVA